MTIGERVISLLEEKGIQKNKLSAFLGTAPSTINGWKNEGKNPKSEFIVPICAFLNVSEHYLLTGEEDNSSDASSFTTNDIDPVLANYIRKLDHDQQIELRGYVKRMVESPD